MGRHWAWALLGFFNAVWAMAEEPLIVAHRGASRDAPENTLPAFELAWRQGADAIEGDFHLTRDGHIVCLHDHDTKKVAERNLVVRQSSLADLRELDVGHHHGDSFAGTCIPTLAEVLATVPKKGKAYLEIKCGPEIIPGLLREIKRSGLETSQVVVISFQAAVIAGVEARAPGLETAWLCQVKKDREGRLSPSPEHALGTLEKIGADGFSSSHSHIDQQYIGQIRKAGYHYHVWTVDGAPTARRFRQWGARSITTNVPGPLRREMAP